MVVLINAFAQAVEHIHEIAKAPRVIQEPVVTWNLFLTAFLVPVCSALTVAFIMSYINWKMKNQVKKNEEIAAAKVKADMEIANLKIAADAEIAEKKRKQDDEIAKLRTELEAEKVAATQAWRKTHTDVLCRVKEKVDGIYEVLDSKVDKDDCDRLMRREP